MVLISQCLPLQELDILQNRDARIITGCVRSTPMDLLLPEANLTPLCVRFDAQIAVQPEKTRRLLVTGPLFKDSTSFLKRSLISHYAHSWQGASDTVLASINLAPEANSMQTYVMENKFFCIVILLLGTYRSATGRASR